jgi:cell wall-associated NlpC family hydrolase
MHGSHGYEIDRRRKRIFVSVRRRAVGTVLAPVIAATTGLALCPPASADTGQDGPGRAVSPPAAGGQDEVRRKPPPEPSPSAEDGVRAAAAVHFAAAQLGKPYRYGGTGPEAFDCSGLTQQAWRAAGVSIPRTTQTQAAVGAAVSVEHIQPGDLVIFYADRSHVGIYAGGGKVIVSPHRGAVVKYAPLHSMPISAVRRPG